MELLRRQMESAEVPEIAAHAAYERSRERDSIVFRWCRARDRDPRERCTLGIDEVERRGVDRSLGCGGRNSEVQFVGPGTVTDVAEHAEAKELEIVDLCGGQHMLWSGWFTSHALSIARATMPGR